MLGQTIREDMVKSLKEGKKTELKVLRFIISEIKYEEIEKKRDLTDEEVVSLLKKEVKKRKDAVDLFKKGNRFDLIQDEEIQIKIINGYLPEQMSEKEIESAVDAIINSSSEKNIGLLMGLVMSKLKGKADGSVVARILKEKISK